MSEYWVSQAKFHCKYCNVWIADNKPTRQLHDGGAKHKFNVDEFHKKKRTEKLFGARSEDDIKKQLAEIDRAAREAVAADREEVTGLFYQKPKPAAPGPPPPPPRHLSSSNEEEDNDYRGSSNRDSTSRARDDGRKEDMVEEIAEEDDSGTYTVDGQTYLEGPKHENLLLRGMNCEIFIEAADQWFSAVVLGRKDVAVPHTNIVLRTFDVTYVEVEEDKNEVENEVESGVEDELKEATDSGAVEEVQDVEEGAVVNTVESDQTLQPLTSTQTSADILVDKSSITTTADVLNQSDQPVVPIPVKRRRVSRWDTHTTPADAPTVVESAMPPISVPPPPPPPPVFSFSKAMPPSNATCAINSSHNTSSEKVEKNVDTEISGDAHVKKRDSTSAIPPPPPPPPRFPSSSSSSSHPSSSSRLVFAEGSTMDDIETSSQIDSSTAQSQAVGRDDDGVLGETDETKSPTVHTIVVSGVRSDILRLLCDPLGNVLGAYGEIVSTPASRRGEKEPVEVVASTGFGAWQTVSVNIVDEEEEALLREEEEMRVKAEDNMNRSGGTGQGNGSSSSKYRQVTSSSSGGIVNDEDAMGTYDPYGTNIYKGVAVGEDRGVDVEESTMRKGEKVGFKKRKKAGSGSSTSNLNSVTVKKEIIQDGAQRLSGHSARNNGNGDNNSGVSHNGASVHVSASTDNYIDSAVVGYSLNAKIKSEPGILNPHMESEYDRIAIPNPMNGNGNCNSSSAEVAIKQEVKIEPKIEPVKVSFGLNGFKKMRKSADNN